MEIPRVTIVTPRLVVVTGWTGAGKSTIAAAIATDIGSTVASFDWLMSALRIFPDIWREIESPAHRQREIGWELLSRVAEQQLRRQGSCVLDLVAREAPRARWRELAMASGASFHVIECICSDVAIHRRLLQGRERGIPGWYEITFEDALHVRDTYVPLHEPKLVLDAADDISHNIAKARTFLGLETANPCAWPRTRPAGYAQPRSAASCRYRRSLRDRPKGPRPPGRMDFQVDRPRCLWHRTVVNAVRDDLDHGRDWSALLERSVVVAFVAVHECAGCAIGAEREDQRVDNDR